MRHPAGSNPARPTIDNLGFPRSLFKNNYFADRKFNGRFRAEILNLFKDVNFGRPAAIVSGPASEVVTVAAPPCQISFALKLLF